MFRLLSKDVSVGAASDFVTAGAVIARVSTFLSSFPNMSTTTGSSQPRFQAFQTMAGPITREQTVEERYGIPENFLEIEVRNPQTHGKREKKRVNSLQHKE